MSEKSLLDIVRNWGEPEFRIVFPEGIFSEFSNPLYFFSDWPSYPFQEGGGFFLDVRALAQGELVPPPVFEFNFLKSPFTEDTAKRLNDYYEQCHCTSSDNLDKRC